MSNEQSNHDKEEKIIKTVVEDAMWSFKTYEKLRFYSYVTLRRVCSDVIRMYKLKHKREPELQPVIDKIHSESQRRLDLLMVTQGEAADLQGRLDAISDVMPGRVLLDYSGSASGVESNLRQALRAIRDILKGEREEKPISEPKPDNLQDLRERAKLTVEDVDQAMECTFKGWGGIELFEDQGCLTEEAMGAVAFLYKQRITAMWAAVKQTKAEHKAQPCE